MDRANRFSTFENWTNNEAHLKQQKHLTRRTLKAHVTSRTSSTEQPSSTQESIRRIASGCDFELSARISDLSSRFVFLASKFCPLSRFRPKTPETIWHVVKRCSGDPNLANIYKSKTSPAQKIIRKDKSALENVTFPLCYFFDNYVSFLEGKYLIFFTS